MNGWTKHTGRAAVLDMENVDTDQLMPARFMSVPRADGYGAFLLHDLRIDRNGQPDPDFPLHRNPDASILIARRNFGSGSSREAAVYALVDFGIRAVIAPSFGDIFAANAVNNGLLPAQVSEDDASVLIAKLGSGQTKLSLYIEKKKIAVGSDIIRFTISEASQQKLIHGWDDIDLTERYRPAISTYRAQRAQSQPWAFPEQERTS